MRIINLIIIKNFFKVIVSFIILNFPLIYLADLILKNDIFDSYQSLIEMPYKYMQVFDIFVLWSVYFGFNLIRLQYGVLALITIGYNKLHSLFSMIILSLIICAFYLFCLQLNDYVFDRKLKITNWSYYKENQNDIFIDKSENKAFVCDENLSCFKNFKIDSENNIYVIWNIAKKLSLSGLTEYKQYLASHQLHYDEVSKQQAKIIFNCLFLCLLVIAGFIFGYYNSLKEAILLTISCHWILELYVFLPLIYGIIFASLIFVFWLIVVLCYLFY